MTYRLAIETTYPETGAGKRSLRQNIYGNYVGFLGRSRFWEFGCGASAKTDGELWVKGYSLTDVHNGEACAAEGLI